MSVSVISIHAQMRKDTYLSYPHTVKLALIYVYIYILYIVRSCVMCTLAGRKKWALSITFISRSRVYVRIYTKYIVGKYKRGSHIRYFWCAIMKQLYIGRSGYNLSERIYKSAVIKSLLASNFELKKYKGFLFLYIKRNLRICCYNRGHLLRENQMW